MAKRDRKITDEGIEKYRYAARILGLQSWGAMRIWIMENMNWSDTQFWWVDKGKRDVPANVYQAYMEWKIGEEGGLVHEPRGDLQEAPRPLPVSRPKSQQGDRPSRRKRSAG